MNPRTYGTRPKETPAPRCNRGEFRLIRSFSIEHNAARLQRYVERLQKSMRGTAAGRRFAARLRLQKRGQP